MNNQLLYKFPKNFSDDSKNYPHSVAIILRTKDRPICLPRAINSVLNQTFKNWQLIIINDGGDKNVLEKTIAPYMKALGERVIVINNPTSQGMSQGLNSAIEASASEFIAVHDDDDSWQPEFLQETVNFLKAAENNDCGGVITYSTQILEEMTKTQIIERERKDFNSRENPFTRISLFRLMMQNTFPPIAFLFRRAVVDKIGDFNLDLPVLNDWDFNIRCAFHYEIGVIPKHLANYHMRTNNQETVYGNSIIATSNLCLQYETVIRNNGLRTMLNSEKHADLVGLVLALGGHYLPSQQSPIKMDFILNNQQQTLTWIDKNLRTPLATDISSLQKQLNNIQDKLDHLLKQQKVEA